MAHKTSSVISESSKLPDKFFTGLNQAIANSSFWLSNNDIDEAEMNSIGGGMHLLQTDAAEDLAFALDDFFKSQSFPIKIVVNSVEPGAQKGKLSTPIGKGSDLYPNGIVVGGEQSIESGRFVMYLHLAPVDETFDPGDVNPSAIASKIGRIVRHELIHTDHFEKRRRKNKVSRASAKDSFEAEGQIPPEGAPRDQYLGAHIEVDAYAHEFAEELLEKLGKRAALDITRGKYSAEELRSLDLSDTLIEYLVDNSDASYTKSLRKKLYTQIQDMVSRGLYESSTYLSPLRLNETDAVVEIADCDRTRAKGLMGRTNLKNNAGMLFVFPDSALRSFWMKETYIPLSIAYMDAQGVILNIENMTPLSLDSVKSSAPAKYALEMNDGWFKEHGIQPGDIINISEQLKGCVMSETMVRKYVRQLLKEAFISHEKEPIVGAHVQNTNPSCKHFGSEGVVLSIDSLPGDAGKTVSYLCTNDGDSWKSGDVLEKTMDQLDSLKAVKA